MVFIMRGMESLPPVEILKELAKEREQTKISVRNMKIKNKPKVEQQGREIFKALEGIFEYQTTNKQAKQSKDFPPNRTSSMVSSSVKSSTSCFGNRHKKTHSLASIPIVQGENRLVMMHEGKKVHRSTQSVGEIEWAADDYQTNNHQKHGKEKASPPDPFPIRDPIGSVAGPKLKRFIGGKNLEGVGKV